MKIKAVALIIFFSFFLSAPFADAAAKPPAWKAATPEGYVPITWAGSRGITTFAKAPEANGHLDFLTVIYLPYNQVKFIASSSPRVEWGESKFGVPAAPTNTNPEYIFIDESASTTPATTTPAADIVSSTVRDWAFAKFQVEMAKMTNKNAKFIWNVPFFNVEIPVTDLSLGLKSTDQTGTYVTSGSRPSTDISNSRRMLIINNAAGTSTIRDFDEEIFINDGDQAVEAFDPNISNKGNDADVARLFLGVKPGGKELIVYCSQGASPSEAREALILAGVPVENQMQADGGNSATCAYNLAGQYFVEPGRVLPHLMGAFPLVGRGTVTTNGLNVRSLPSAKGKVLRKLKLKEPVIIYESKSGWYRIGENSEWVSSSLVKQTLK